MRRLHLLSALLVTASVLHADTVTLNDGTEHEGEVVRQTDDSITLRVRMGGIKGNVTILRKEIAAISKAPVPEDKLMLAAQPLIKAAETATNKTDCIAKWVSVADHFQNRRGYSAQINDAWQHVLLQDPNHTGARSALGYSRDERGNWVHRDVINRQLKERAEAAELRIGLRDDESIQRKQAENSAQQRALEVANAKLRAELEQEQRMSAQIQRVNALEEYQTGYGYGCRNGLGIPYYSNPWGYGVRVWDGTPTNLNPCLPAIVYPGGGAYYGSRNNYYGGGLGLGFSGRFGSVNFSGGINNGFGFGGYGCRR